MGRKNFYGSRTINGADVTATLYTVIESCKKVEIDPKAYILMAVKKTIAKEKKCANPSPICPEKSSQDRLEFWVTEIQQNRRERKTLCKFGLHPIGTFYFKEAPP